MTFEQTMHTIESHLASLTRQYNAKVISLQDEIIKLKEENKWLKEAHKPKEEAEHLANQCKPLNNLWGTPFDSSRGMPKAPKNTEWKR